MLILAFPVEIPIIRVLVIGSQYDKLTRRIA